MTWRERVVAARERGKFTSYDRYDAAKWLTCAVGEQRDLHPGLVKYDGMFCVPLDPEFIYLGGAAGFLDAVRNDRFDKAEDFLDKIEDRVLELKREKGGENVVGD